MHAPELLLLDEPLSSLDERSMHAVIEALQQEQKNGCIIVMSTHNLSAIASFTPQVIKLQHGKAFLE
jgi:ABC-2 type transport system ATP-binding protein